MKFTERKNCFTLEGIDGKKDIKFSNLGGVHTNSPFDDPSKDPQRAITIWFDDDDIAKGLRDNDFLVGRAEDKYHKDPETKEPLGERYFIKFVAYPKMRMNPRTGKEEQMPKIVTKTSAQTTRQLAEGFGNVDTAYIDTIDISFRQYKYDPKRPCVAAINELWCILDETADGRNDFEDDYLEQKYADIPMTDEDEVPFA